MFILVELGFLEPIAVKRMMARAMIGQKPFCKENMSGSSQLAEHDRPKPARTNRRHLHAVHTCACEAERSRLCVRKNPNSNSSELATVLFVAVRH